MKVRTNEWQETYMEVLTKYVLRLVDKADSVPEHLKETIPCMYKPKNLLNLIDQDELAQVTKVNKTSTKNDKEN